MSIINRRGIFGLFGGGVAASIAGDKFDSPVQEVSGYISGAGQTLAGAVPERVYHARHLVNLSEQLNLPSRSVRKFKQDFSWLEADEASINSMKSISQSTRARMLLEIHLNRSSDQALQRRREVMGEYAKPLLLIGAITQADLDTLIETGEGIEKIKALASIQ